MSSIVTTPPTVQEVSGQKRRGLHYPTSERLDWRIDRLDEKLDRKFDSVDEDIHALDKKVTALDIKIVGLDAKIAGLDAKIDKTSSEIRGEMKALENNIIVTISKRLDEYRENLEKRLDRNLGWLNWMNGLVVVMVTILGVVVAVALMLGR